jgi:hypothetical protein
LTQNTAPAESQLEEKKLSGAPNGQEMAVGAVRISSSDRWEVRRATFARTGELPHHDESHVEGIDQHAIEEAEAKAASSQNPVPGGAR